MGCLVNLNLDLYSVKVSAVMYVTSCYYGWRFNGTDCICVKLNLNKNSYISFLSNTFGNIVYHEYLCWTYKMISHLFDQIPFASLIFGLHMFFKASCYFKSTKLDICMYIFISYTFKYVSTLTHLPLDKMATIWADDIFNCIVIFLNEKFEFWLKFNWSWFLRV